jgi:hypothetical protein
MARARGLLMLALSVVGAASSLLVASPSRAQSADAPVDGDAPVAAPADDSYTDTDPSALSDFRPTLDAHGAWSDDASYGTVWTPNPTEVGADFQPYDTSGQWSYDGGDYNWESSFEWGWICFHYGRWAFSPTLGWMWIPGRTYAAAWVTWRTPDDGYGYVGWSPIAPSWGWFGGSATAIAATTSEPWAFTTRTNLLSPNVSTTTVRGTQAAQAYQHSHTYVHAGAASGDASSRAAGSPFAPFLPHGPPPSMLGIEGLAAARALSAGDVRARQFARPSTAVPLGAHAPIPHVVRTAPRGSSSHGATQRVPVRAHR